MSHSNHSETICSLVSYVIWRGNSSKLSSFHNGARRAQTQFCLFLCGRLCKWQKQINCSLSPTLASLTYNCLLTRSYVLNNIESERPFNCAGWSANGLYWTVHTPKYIEITCRSGRNCAKQDGICCIIQTHTRVTKWKFNVKKRQFQHKMHGTIKGTYRTLKVNFQKKEYGNEMLAYSSLKTVTPVLLMFIWAWHSRQIVILLFTRLNQIHHLRQWQPTSQRHLQL